MVKPICWVAVGETVARVERTDLVVAHGSDTDFVNDRIMDAVGEIICVTDAVTLRVENNGETKVDLRGGPAVVLMVRAIVDVVALAETVFVIVRVNSGKTVTVPTIDRPTGVVVVVRVVVVVELTVAVTFRVIV